MTKTWLVTGCSSGFGRAIVLEALRRGDNVVATARNVESIRSLGAGANFLALPLDVTRADEIEVTITRVIETFGRIDVLVNNAGFGSVGAVEETSDRELRDQFDTNFFGAVDLTRAALPQMRQQQSGTVVQISSFGGLVTYPGFGAYCATKHALESISEALAAEVAPLGIRVLIVEPGAFRTGFGAAGMKRSSAIAAYLPTVGPTRAFVDSMDQTQPGDPAKAARAIADAVDDGSAPLRLPLGRDAVENIRRALGEIQDNLERTETVALNTEFDAIMESA
jgi:NAD(P)-dependent dehydrogenase (short-subunit alcohol dehydrogenase family)